MMSKSNVLISGMPAPFARHADFLKLFFQTFLMNGMNRIKPDLLVMLFSCVDH